MLDFLISENSKSRNVGFFQCSVCSCVCAHTGREGKACTTEHMWELEGTFVE